MERPGFAFNDSFDLKIKRLLKLIVIQSTGKIVCWLLFLLCIIHALSSIPASAVENSDSSPPKKIAFPGGDIFLPLIADPKQPQFAGSIVQVHPEVEQGFDEDFVGGFVVYGETLGMIRMQEPARKKAWQISIKGGLFAQFNLEGDSMPLLNTDYLIALAHTYRRDALSFRTILYHQSTHLGDELILEEENDQVTTKRINFSYEAIDVIGSYEWRQFRFYAGGFHAVRTDPVNFKKWGCHSGLEYYSTRKSFLGGKPLGGIDIKLNQEQDWEPNTSLKIGIQYGNGESCSRYVRVMAEFYDGYIPFGQFFDDKMQTYGLGFSFGF